MAFVKCGGEEQVGGSQSSQDGGWEYMIEALLSTQDPCEKKVSLWLQG